MEEGKCNFIKRLLLPEPDQDPVPAIDHLRGFHSDNVHLGLAWSVYDFACCVINQSRSKWASGWHPVRLWSAQWIQSNAERDKENIYATDMLQGCCIHVSRFWDDPDRSRFLSFQQIHQWDILSGVVTALVSMGKTYQSDSRRKRGINNGAETVGLRKRKC